jgi:hypothetical protein
MLSGLPARGAVRTGLPRPPPLHDLARSKPAVRWMSRALVHVWSTCHRRRAVPSGLQRYVVRAGRRCDPGETGRVQNPDKDEVLRYGEPAVGGSRRPSSAGNDPVPVHATGACPQGNAQCSGMTQMEAPTGLEGRAARDRPIVGCSCSHRGGDSDHPVRRRGSLEGVPRWEGVAPTQTTGPAGGSLALGDGCKARGSPTRTRSTGLRGKT